MNFEDSLEAHITDSSEEASLKLIEFLENEENFDPLFDYWKSLNQHHLQREKSEIIYLKIMAEISKDVETKLGKEKESSISFECGPLQWRVA